MIAKNEREKKRCLLCLRVLACCIMTWLLLQQTMTDTVADDRGLREDKAVAAAVEVDMGSHADGGDVGDNDEETEKMLDDDDDEEVEVDGEDGEDGDGEEAGSNLLESLTTDIAKYHKKVEKKAKGTGKVDMKDDDEGVADMQEEDVDEDEADDTGKESTKELRKRPAPVEDTENDAEYTDPDAVGKRRKTGRKQKSDRKVVEWSKEEDDAIVYYKEEMKYSWKRIEELLESKHSWQAIQMRYLRNHKSRNEDWSKFMEVKLINAVRKDWENRWRRISAELGKHFTPERCLAKNIDICKKIETDYYTQVFQNKELTNAYLNPLHDIKDPEQHKKLLLVYMGLDSISYEDEPDAAEAAEVAEAATAVTEATKTETETATETAAEPSNDTADAK